VVEPLPQEFEVVCAETEDDFKKLIDSNSSCIVYVTDTSITLIRCNRLQPYNFTDNNNISDWYVPRHLYHRHKFQHATSFSGFCPETQELVFPSQLTHKGPSPQRPWLPARFPARLPAPLIFPYPVPYILTFLF